MEISPLTPDGGRKGDLVRLPSNIDLSELQDILDYLRYKELISTSKAKQSDVDKLAKEVNASMWKKVSKRIEI
jgi:hypothetical protein